MAADSRLAADAISLLSERIPLRCPITQGKIKQACRLLGCTHAAAFDIAAKPAIVILPALSSAAASPSAAASSSAAASPAECYRCPVCGTEANEFVIDVVLTLFVSANPLAETCRVKHGADGTWQYSRPSNKSGGGSRACSSSNSKGACSIGGNANRKSNSNSSRSSSTGSEHRSSRSDGSVDTNFVDSTRVSGSKRDRVGEASGCPKALPQEAKHEARWARRERAARAKQLDATKAALIHRALHDDSSTGGALWDCG